MFGFFNRPAKVDAATALPGRATPVLALPFSHRIFGDSLDAERPGTEVAYFGLGCFWGAEKLYWQTPGVVSTGVGYMGGYTANPTYQEVCSGMTGHAEVVRVVFDPAQVSYRELLKIFFENHDPTQGDRQGNDVGTQGEFNRSSQHLDHGGVQRWRRRTGAGRPAMCHRVHVGSGVRIGRCARRCVLRGGLSPRGRCSGSSGV